MPTEHQYLMWLVYCGLGSSALLAFIVIAIKKYEDVAGYFYGAGIGMSGGAIATAIVAFFIGLFVKLYDVPSHPGLGQGLESALTGLLIGGGFGTLGGAFGGFLADLVVRRK